MRGDGPWHCRSRPAQRETPREAFPFLEFLFHLTFQADEKIKQKEIFRELKKCEILHGDRFEYLP
jgi:hypothetical protein